MKKKEIEKFYVNKIHELKKHDKAYHLNDNPIVSDSKYDKIKNEITNLEKKYKFLKNRNSSDDRVGYKSSNKFKKIKHLKPMLSLSNAFTKNDMKDFLTKILSC